ncbi:aminoglycoside adenylyltransferase, partial [Streptomyces azureus]
MVRLGLPHSLQAVDRERSARQLRLIGETVEFAKALGVEVWLRGGWAMDFFIGEPTRDHEDIDWFA